MNILNKYCEMLIRYKTNHLESVDKNELRTDIVDLSNDMSDRENEISKLFLIDLDWLATRKPWEYNKDFKIKAQYLLTKDYQRLLREKKYLEASKTLRMMLLRAETYKRKNQTKLMLEIAHIWFSAENYVAALHIWTTLISDLDPSDIDRIFTPLILCCEYVNDLNPLIKLTKLIESHKIKIKDSNIINLVNFSLSSEFFNEKDLSKLVLSVYPLYEIQINERLHFLDHLFLMRNFNGFRPLNIIIYLLRINKKRELFVFENFMAFNSILDLMLNIIKEEIESKKVEKYADIEYYIWLYRTVCLIFCYRYLYHENMFKFLRVKELKKIAVVLAEYEVWAICGVSQLESVKEYSSLNGETIFSKDLLFISEIRNLIFNQSENKIRINFEIKSFIFIDPFVGSERGILNLW